MVLSLAVRMTDCTELVTSSQQVLPPRSCSAYLSRSTSKQIVMYVDAIAASPQSCAHMRGLRYCCPILMAVFQIQLKTRDARHLSLLADCIPMHEDTLVSLCELGLTVCSTACSMFQDCSENYFLLWLIPGTALISACNNDHHAGRFERPHTTYTRACIGAYLRGTAQSIVLVPATGARQRGAHNGGEGLDALHEHTGSGYVKEEALPVACDARCE